MKKKTATKKVGRPQKQIDWQLVKSLCAIHCTQREILDIIKCDDKTLGAAIKREFGDANFSEFFKRESASGKASLRRTQWELAKKNAAMAIWLGKQYLEQRDIMHTATEEPINHNGLSTFLNKLIKRNDDGTATETT